MGSDVSCPSSLSLGPTFWAPKSELSQSEQVAGGVSDGSKAVKHGYPKTNFREAVYKLALSAHTRIILLHPESEFHDTWMRLKWIKESLSRAQKPGLVGNGICNLSPQEHGNLVHMRSALRCIGSPSESGFPHIPG